MPTIAPLLRAPSSNPQGKAGKGRLLDETIYTAAEWQVTDCRSLLLLPLLRTEYWPHVPVGGGVARDQRRRAAA